MRVGILGAGGPAGVNLARSLRMAGHDVVGIEGNPWHAPYLVGIAEVVLLPEAGLWDAQTLAFVQEVVAEKKIDVLLAQPDPMVEWLGRYRESFDAAVPLPATGIIQLCQNKFECGIQWRRDSLRHDRLVKIEDDDGIREAEAKLGYPYWMRASHGAGARGASEILSEAQAFAWITYWVERGVEWDFIAEGFLPGRDFAWTSLWWRGELICSQARERLEYIYPHLAPSGRTGTPTVALTVRDERVNTVAAKAVMSIDPEPHGVYCVDLREDVAGYPRPTEINCGRFFTTSLFYAQAGVNFADILVRLATDGPKWWLHRPDMSEPTQYNSVPRSYYWIRHIDCGEHLVPVDKFLPGRLALYLGYENDKLIEA